MVDKLNGILVKDTVIELLKSNLAAWLSVAAQKKLNLAHPPAKGFFLFFFLLLRSEVHVLVKDFPSPKTLCIIWARLRSVAQSSSALIREEHFETFNLKSLCWLEYSSVTTTTKNKANNLFLSLILELEYNT